MALYNMNNNNQGLTLHLVYWSKTTLPKFIGQVKVVCSNRKYEEFIIGMPKKTSPVHGPVRQYATVLFQMKPSGILRGSILREKLPMDGSEGLFHDVSSTFSPLLLLFVIFMFGSKVSVGFLKLSHTLSPALSIRTRLPESKSWQVEFVAMLDTFDDQITFLVPFITTRFPSSDIAKLPKESLSGWFLLANHTTVDSVMYQIPT
ncbi:hypothetical protein Lal_00039082 [Lupinus albus]|nr:hypothetical protein Lal_00039082 [Lupinus albus]